MLTIDDIRNIAQTYPATTEATHFTLPAFKVADTVFVVLQKDNHAILSVSKDVAAQLTADKPELFRAIWRNNETIFVGVRADLAKISLVEIAPVIQAAWQNKAPKRLLK